MVVTYRVLFLPLLNPTKLMITTRCSPKSTLPISDEKSFACLTYKVQRIHSNLDNKTQLVSTHLQFSIQANLHNYVVLKILKLKRYPFSRSTILHAKHEFSIPCQYTNDIYKMKHQVVQNFQYKQHKCMTNFVFSTITYLPITHSSPIWPKIISLNLKNKKENRHHGRSHMSCP